MSENKYTIKEFADAFNPHFTRQAILKHVDPSFPEKGNIPVEQGRRGYLIDIDNFKVKEFIKNAGRKFTKKTVKVVGEKTPKKLKTVGSRRQKDIDKLKSIIVPEEKDLIDKITSKIPGIEKGLLKAAEKIKDKANNKKKDDKKKQPENDLPYDIYDRLDSGEMLTATEIVNLPKDWVEKIKLYEQIKSLNQNREEKRKDLVQKRLVRPVIGKIYETEQTQFLTLKTKIIPEVASLWSESITVTKEMVGKKIEIFIGNRSEAITAADKVIDDNCYQILGNIKRDIDKFLKLIHDEPIS